GDAGGCDTPKAHTGSGHVAARLRRAPRDQPWWTQLGRMQLGLLVGVALLFVRRSR
ncbi:MAG: hypothetical protein IT379_19455, partial [Deltaproteobacteria bacterium]|nr:hypothetical protein [Deltaproteobacteria bacterium]